jgi:hypothetical protein
MANDPKCKYRHSCGYDFCMGEGVCSDFEKGKPIDSVIESQEKEWGK